MSTKSCAGNPRRATTNVRRAADSADRSDEDADDDHDDAAAVADSAESRRNMSMLRFVSRMSVSSSAAAAAGPVQLRIEQKLRSTFSPTFLSVLNESFKHNVPRGAETHFNVTVVSEQFEAVTLIDRHRKVQEALRDELASGVHALSIQAKTPAQWGKNAAVQSTPNCLGGSKS